MRGWFANFKEATGVNYGWSRYPEKRRDYSRKRNALLRGAPDYEDFKSLEVFERDNYICGICTEPVDRDLVYPSMRMASLDHIQPVSLGGSHTRANTRCSHLDCNITRGAKYNPDIDVLIAFEQDSDPDAQEADDASSTEARRTQAANQHA